MQYKKMLYLYILKHNLAHCPLLVYTYWFTPATYAAFMLKTIFPHIQIISRSHGIDLFRSRHPGQYLPLRSLCCNWVDCVCPCSQAGAQELLESGTCIDRIRLSYLGVPAAPGIATPSAPGRLSLASCSGITPEKRLPLLMDSLAAFARARPDLRVRWTHIGGSGKALSACKNLAQQTLAVPNLSYKFLGQVPLREVRAFYQQECFDVFINVSSTEGLPVSMMEAVSAGIPIIGTNVGGVSELVNQYTGFLLQKNFSNNEFIAAVSSLDRFKNLDMRKNIVSFSLSKFNDKTNYSNFIEKIIYPFLNKSQKMLMEERRPSGQIGPQPPFKGQ
jgi:glycosyltransferase involved in cell wall biosynthesis